ncbi:MAG: transcription antitermination factor NusB [Proteobacteria bacterium]|nr:transcription antitermination factor NusB [Pseudomonadota bacterium]MBW3618328.1 transcription antitermination factor NusB [Pseudomonadota bacterium]
MSDKSLAGVLRILQGGIEPDPVDAPEIEPAELQPQPGAAQRRGRTVARLAAVQALYQMEVAGTGVEAVIREFSEHRFGRAPEGDQGPPLADADEEFFAQLVRGVVADQKAVDGAVVRRLAKDWKLERLDATVRAMLRAGAWELMHRPDVPSEVAIDEYVELAKSFFEQTEPGFVNAALDGVARDVRR